MDDETTRAVTDAASPVSAHVVTASSAAQLEQEPQQNAGSNRGLVIFWSCVTVFIFILAGGLVYWISATITGREFDVVSWQTRDFSYRRDPFTHRQLSNIVHETSRIVAVDATIAMYIVGGPISPTPQRWDLVEISRGNSSVLGDASVLVEYLTATDSSEKEYWVEWTVNNAAAAPSFWAAVRDAIHLPRPRYDRLPDMFEAARAETNPAALKATLQSMMSAIALEDTRAHLAAGDTAAAQRTARLGLTYDESDELRAVLGPEE